MHKFTKPRKPGIGHSRSFMRAWVDGCVKTAPLGTSLTLEFEQERLSTVSPETLLLRGSCSHLSCLYTLIAMGF